MSAADDRLEIVSHYPGRLRVRAEAFRALPEVADEVVEHLCAREGIRGARAVRTTGSLVIEYDPRAIQLPELVQEVLRTSGIGAIAGDLAERDRSPALDGDGVRRALGALRERVLGGSDRQVDLKVAVPGALASTGLLMFLGGRRRIPEWYDLLFWSFVSFVNLNPPGGAELGPATSRDGQAR